MALLDVFSGDGFGWMELTDSFIKLPYQPMRLGELGLFQEAGVRTTSIDVESKDGRLSLIQSSPRGAPGVDPLGAAKRTLRTFKTYHFERESKILADEVQNIRAYGSQTEFMQVEALATERMSELRPMHEVTQEYHRVNALRGVLLDADGSTLKNLFTEFDVTQQTLDIALGTTTTDVRARIVAAIRLSEAELGGTVALGYRGFCSAGWFDAFVGHTEVKEAHKYQESQVLRDDLRAAFRFGMVDWEEYRGSVARPDSIGGTSAFIEANVAYLVPITSPSIFVTRYSPADFEEAVNIPGLPLYAKQVADPSGMNKFRTLHTQANFISLCLRPRAVILLTKS